MEASIAAMREGATDYISGDNGLHGEFMGEWTLLLAGLGTAALVWFAWRKTSPGLSRSLLLAGPLFFAAGLSLTIADMGREFSSTTVRSSGKVYEECRGFGIYTTLIASGLALLLTMATFLSPKTIYEDEED